MSRPAVAYTGVLMKGRRALTRWLPRQAVSYFAQRLPVVAGIRDFIRRHLIPRSTQWVQVQQGFAKGIWIRIDLSSERSWWAGTHEPAAQDLLRRVIAEDTVFYDVGAHIGFFSLSAARIAARVIAFEPDPENAERLRANVVRNHLDHKIEIVEAAMWSDTTPSITFRTGIPRSQGGVVAEKRQPVLATGSLIQVAATRLDDLISGGVPAPQVMKVDVEGAASEVLMGALETVRTLRPTLIIEVHTSVEYDGVLHFLEPLSYDVAWSIPPEGFPRQCFAFSRLPYESGRTANGWQSRKLENTPERLPDAQLDPFLLNTKE
jgi:FkbM family methyltransferase